MADAPTEVVQRFRAMWEWAKDGSVEVTLKTPSVTWTLTQDEAAQLARNLDICATVPTNWGAGPADGEGDAT